MMRTAIQAGAAWTCTSEISAAEMSSLSAMGSSNVPIVVICPQRRARKPSSRSVPAAVRKMTSASNSLVKTTPRTSNAILIPTRAATSSGTKKIRAIVREFGRFITAGPLPCYYVGESSWPLGATLRLKLRELLLERLGNLRLDDAVVVHVLRIDDAPIF